MIIPLRSPGLTRNFGIQLPQYGVSLNLDANSVDLSRNYPWDHGQVVGVNPKWRNQTRESTVPIGDAEKLPAGTEPKLQRLRPDSVLFNGSTDTLFIPNSKGTGPSDGFFLPQITGACDIIMGLRITSYPSGNAGIVGNTMVGGEEGFAVYIDSSGFLHFDLRTAANLVVAAMTSTPIPLDTLLQIRIFSDGSEVFFFFKHRPYAFPNNPFLVFSPIDGPIPFTGSTSVNPSTNNITIGSASGDVAAPDQNFAGELFYLLLGDGFMPTEIGLVDAFMDDKLVQR